MLDKVRGDLMGDTPEDSLRKIADYVEKTKVNVFCVVRTEGDKFLAISNVDPCPQMKEAVSCAIDLLIAWDSARGTVQ